MFTHSSRFSEAQERNQECTCLGIRTRTHQLRATNLVVYSALAIKLQVEITFLAQVNQMTRQSLLRAVYLAPKLQDSSLQGLCLALQRQVRQKTSLQGPPLALDQNRVNLQEIRKRSLKANCLELKEAARQVSQCLVALTQRLRQISPHPAQVVAFSQPLRANPHQALQRRLSLPQPSLLAAVCLASPRQRKLPDRLASSLLANQTLRRIKSLQDLLVSSLVASPA